jgi:hypothetical protein
MTVEFDFEVMLDIINFESLFHTNENTTVAQQG